MADNKFLTEDEVAQMLGVDRSKRPCSEEEYHLLTKTMLENPDTPTDVILKRLHLEDMDIKRMTINRQL